MKRLTLILLIAGLLGLGGQAFAERCSIDAVPAATLLVPYFEVDLGATAQGQGRTTLFSINNASAAPALAHVVFWTDWSSPTIDFDVYLTGYDIQTVDVWQVFQGNIPITADAPNDDDDTISPHGLNRAWDDTEPPVFEGPADDLFIDLDGFPGCGAIFPLFTNPVIQGTALDRLLNGHTGQPVASLGGGAGDCLGYDHGDNIARGYITVDNVSECSLVLDPRTGGYFAANGTGIVTNNNQLWGDWFLVDPANNFAQGDTLVHIEAFDNFTGDVMKTQGGTGGYTFYGRYIDGSVDNREPLGTTWGSRYLNGGVFDQSELIVWRDSAYNSVNPAGRTCRSTDANGNPDLRPGPPWFPLNETEVIAWNEREDAVEICFFDQGVISPPDTTDPRCFPWETGRYPVGDDPLDLPYNFGWLFLNLNWNAFDIVFDDVLGFIPDPLDVHFGQANITQSYVTTLHSALGRYSVGLSALEITDACQDVSPTIAGVIPQF